MFVRKNLFLEREYDIRRDNKFMADKITAIFNFKSPTKEKEKMIFARSQDRIFARSEKEKWKLFRIAQENQFMLKRLHETQPTYKNKQFNIDYKKAMYIKSKICMFPEISTNNGDRAYSIIDTLREKNSPSKTFYPIINHHKDNKELMNKTYNHQPINKKTSKNKSKNQNSNSDQKNQKVMCSKVIFLQDLLQCNVKFYLENKMFVISIHPVESSFEKFYLVFKGVDEINKMKNIYNSYEDITNDLDHNIHSDLIYVKNKNFTSIYVSFIFIKTSLKVKDIDIIDKDNELADILNKFNQKNNKIKGEEVLNYTSTIKKIDNNQGSKTTKIEEKNSHNISNNEDMELNEIIKKYENIKNKQNDEADDILLKGEINFEDKEKVHLQNIISDYENDPEEKIEKRTNDLINNSDDNSYIKDKEINDNNNKQDNESEKENFEKNDNPNEFQDDNDNIVDEEV